MATTAGGGTFTPTKPKLPGPATPNTWWLPPKTENKAGKKGPDAKPTVANPTPKVNTVPKVNPTPKTTPRPTVPASLPKPVSPPKAPSVPNLPPNPNDVWVVPKTPDDVVEKFSIPDPKSTAQYQSAISNLANQLGQLFNRQQLARGQYDTGFEQNLRDMGFRVSGNPQVQSNQMQMAKGTDPTDFVRGLNPAVNNPYSTYEGQFEWDPTTSLGQLGSYGQDVRANRGDFAGRNNFYSGAMQQAAANINNTYNRRFSDMNTARQDYFDRLQNTENEAVTQAQTEEQNVLASIIQALAGQYGVDSGMIPGFGEGEQQFERRTPYQGETTVKKIK